MLIDDLVVQVKTYIDKIEMSDSITEDTISEELLAEVQSVYDLTGLTEAEVAALGYDLNNDPPNAVAQYLKWQVIYNNLVKNLIGKTADSGASETLGDYSYTVGKGFAADYKYLLDDIREKLTAWKNAILKLFGIDSTVSKFAQAKAVIRSANPTNPSTDGTTEEYPFTTRGSW